MFLQFLGKDCFGCMEDLHVKHVDENFDHQTCEDLLRTCWYMTKRSQAGFFVQDKSHAPEKHASACVKIKVNASQVKSMQARLQLALNLFMRTCNNIDQAAPGGGGTWVNFCWVCAAGLSEPLPHYSLFCDQL